VNRGQGRGKRPRSVLDLLSGPGEDAVTSLTRLILAADSDLRNLPRAVRRAAARAAAAQAAGLLDVDLIGLVVAGWRDHRDLAIAARRTLASPGRTERAELAAHRITTSQQAGVTIVAGGQQAITLELDLLIEFEIRPGGRDKRRAADRLSLRALRHPPHAGPAGDRRGDQARALRAARCHPGQPRAAAAAGPRVCAGRSGPVDDVPARELTRGRLPRVSPGWLDQFGS
jgi:hypothetical protein